MRNLMPYEHRVRQCGLWLASLTIAAAGCGGDDGRTTPNPDPPPVSSLTLSVTNDTILVQSTLRLIATPLDSAATSSAAGQLRGPPPIHHWRAFPPRAT
jgi:hypothetical protein